MSLLGDTDTGQVRLGRNWLRAGDPCRWRGHRGLFRFVKVEKPAADGQPATLELVGPVANPRTRYAPASSVVRVRPTEALRAMVAARV